ncbi:MAG: hypothetical protein C0415_02695 [Thermodesulfovibrio sp.]|nr:hypothetical protein [Thermodesulfovibrio sp.]
MVKIFYTSFGFGDTAGFLFQKSLENIRYPDYSKILYLAPASKKVKESQKIFHKTVTAQLSEAGNSCYIPPEIVSISQLSKKLYSIHGEKRILSRHLIPVVISKLSGKGLGFSSLITDFIHDIKSHYPDIAIDAIKHSFIEILKELNIPESIEKVITACLDEFEKYQSFLAENGLVDEDDVINFSPAYIPFMPSPSVLILDGFYDITLSEMNVLKALIQTSKKTVIAISYDAAFKDLSERYITFLKDSFNVEEQYLTGSGGSRLPIFNYNPYPDMEEEVEGIARNIKSLYVSGKVRELEQVIVTCSDLNKYSALIERVFKRYGIPYDISRKKPPGKTRPFLDLLSLLYSVAEDYPRLKFSQLLSSGYFTKMPESLKKWIPLFSIQSGIISGKTAWLNFISEGSEVLDITAIEEREEIEKDLKRVFKKLKPLDDIKNGSTFDAYTDLLQKIIEDFGFKVSLDELSEKTPQEIVRDLFEQLSFIRSLYTDRITLLEFMELFSHILNSTYTDTEGAGVKVMDFFETAGLAPEYLFFGGVTDRDMPKKQDMDYILPDNVRRRLGFLYLDKYTDIQKFIFSNLVRSSKNPQLSYPVMDGDDMFLPSSFLYSGEEGKVRIPGIFCNEEYLIRSGRMPFSNLIGEMQISPSILKPRSYLRVTDIDAYRACPRKFFIERILGLKPLDLKEYEVEAVTIGIIIHRIMEQMIKEPLEDINYLKNRAVEIIEKILKDKKIDPYWKRFIKDTFIEILPDIRENELEMRGEDYISTDAEKTITGEPIKGIKLKGKIDRFDRIGDYVQIIDYKTGTAGLTCSQVTKGNEDLQLFLYAAVMKSHGYKVGRVGIYSLKDIKIKWCPPKRKSRTKDKETIDDYITASLKFLEFAVNSMRKGDFKAKPLKEQNCMNCHENSFCPYIQQ